MKSKLFVRPAVGASIVSVAALLAACGGGEDSASLISEVPQDLSATEERLSVGPSTWETLEDESATQIFQATLQVNQAPTEQAMALSTGARVKWNPGHYIAVSGTWDDEVLKKTLVEIKPFPQVKGVLVRYGWNQLETSKDVYNFTTLDKDVALAAAQGKRVFFMISSKAFSAGGRAVPDYMRTAEYGGGVYQIKIGGKVATGSTDTYGENAALYNAKVRDRLIALNTALGKRYNLNNAVEGIVFNETALGDAVVPLTSEQKTAFFSNIALANSAARQAWPNSVTMQFINFPRPYMPALVDNMVSSGTALGGPDTFFHDSDLNKYTYPLYDVAQGKVPIGPSVQPENYVTTYFQGPYNPPAIGDLHAFAQNRLHANYLFWTRSLAKPLQPYGNLLQYFGSSAFPKDSAGGLATACPSTIGSCVSKL